MDNDYIKDIADYFNSLTKTYDFADIRIGSKEYLRLESKDKKIIKSNKGFSSGFSMRIYDGKFWYSGSSTDISKESIKKVFESIRKSQMRINLPENKKLKLNPEINKAEIKPQWKKDLRETDIKEKIELVRIIEESANIKGIEGTDINYSEDVDFWVVANNSGTFVSFYNSYPIINLSVSIKDSNGRQRIMHSFGGNAGFELFDSKKLRDFAKNTAEIAINMIDAKPVKGGRYDVVLDSAMTGVYTHEAFGHATEADGIINKNSILVGKMNNVVGNDIVNIADDPTIEGARGSFKFDQEGTTAKRRLLVENGVLKDYLNSMETAAILGMKPNGAARAMDISSLPIPRMSNTFILPSKEKVDIFEGIKIGVAFFDFQYGYTLPGSGNFMFKSQYGRMIRNGKLAEYVRDAALSGNTLDILKRVERIGNDFELHNGTCGKEDQWVPVTTGGPSIMIRDVVVGGQ